MANTIEAIEVRVLGLAPAQRHIAELLWLLDWAPHHTPFAGAFTRFSSRTIHTWETVPEHSPYRTLSSQAKVERVSHPLSQHMQLSIVSDIWGNSNTCGQTRAEDTPKFAA